MRGGPKDWAWWICFWLAIIALNSCHPKARINVYVDGKQVETR